MKNVVLLICECFRYDYLPKSLASLGSAVLTGAAGLYTPTCITSILTGRDPTNHTVRRFFDKLQGESILDLPHWKNRVYFDISWDSFQIKVLGRRGLPITDLDEIEPPFLWIERLYDSHSPYGVLQHGGGFPPDWDEWRTRANNIEMRRGDNCLAEYPKGIASLEKHIRRHLNMLNKRGLKDDTLVVITGDHGELLGEFCDGERIYFHGWPPCYQLIEVPTIWVDQDVNQPFMRQIDIAPTILGIMNLPIPEWMDGVDVTRVNPPLVFNNVKEVCLTIWEYNKEKGGVEMKEWSKDRIE